MNQHSHEIHQYPCDTIQGSKTSDNASCDHNLAFKIAGQRSLWIRTFECIVMAEVFGSEKREYNGQQQADDANQS